MRIPDFVDELRRARSCASLTAAVVLSGLTPAAAFAASDAAPATISPLPKAPAGLKFDSVLDMKQFSPQVKAQLRRAEIASSLDWPASLLARFQTAEGTFSCTAALVSAQVIVTAAHCVPADGKLGFTFGGKTHEAVCHQHPDYVAQRDASADYGLCRITTTFTPPAGMLYERIDATPMADLVGSMIILTGYGCTSDVEGGGIDGKYRVGSNFIAETSRSPHRTFGAPYYEPAEDNNLLTAVAGANLCPGDSGGPAFRIVSGPRTGPDANRRLIGINSRVFYEDPVRRTYGSSLVSAVSTPAFTNWARKWAADNAVQICGLAGSPLGCR